VLDSEQVDKIRLVLASQGWNDVIQPAIVIRGKEAVKALCKSISERDGSFKGVSDDVLRATIRECEWMLSHWQSEVLAFEHNRRLDELGHGTPTAANP
jgi:hypothetical protein